MGTIVSKEAAVALLAEHAKVGKRRVVLHDPKDQWRLVVRVDLAVGSLTIQSGNGDLDGWDDDDFYVHHEVSGADTGYLREFAEFVVSKFVGDERILDCIEHLIQCQS
jgi:hypothetical protein